MICAIFAFGVTTTAPAIRDTGLVWQASGLDVTAERLQRLFHEHAGGMISVITETPAFLVA